MFGRQALVGTAGRFGRRIQTGHVAAWCDGASGDAIRFFKNLVARLARPARGIFALAFGFQLLVVDHIADGVFGRAFGSLCRSGCLFGKRIIFLSSIFHFHLQRKVVVQSVFRDQHELNDG